jgi:PAS domain S-box-containing protein
MGDAAALPLETLAELVDLAFFAMIVRDPASRILRWNRRAEELYGFSAEEALGRVTHELLATHFPISAAAVDEELARTGRWQGELVHRKRDGSTITVLSRQALQRDDNGVPSAVLEINMDLTALKSAEAELSTLNASLEQRVSERTAQLQEAVRQRDAEIALRRLAEQQRQTYLKRLRSLLDVSTSVLSETTLPGLLQRVVDAGRELTTSGIGVSGHGFRDGAFQIGATSRRAADHSCPPGEVFKIERGGVYMDLIQGRRSIRLSDDELVHHPAWWGLPEGHAPLHGLLGATLIGHDGLPSGLIMVSVPAHGEYTAEDEAILVQLAALASIALQHIEAHEEVERRATEAEEAHRTQAALLDGMTEGLIIADPQGNILTINPAGLKILGFERLEDALGFDRDDARPVQLTDLDGRPLPPERWPLARARAGEAFTGYEVMLRRIDTTGYESILNYGGTPVRDAGGRLALAIATFRDVTAQKRNERSLQEATQELGRLLAETNAAAEQLAAANKELDAFGYSVSHDLRAPLRAIDGFSAALLDDHAEQLDDEGQRYLRLVRENAQQMGHLIDDLLAFSRLGRQALKRQRLALGDVIGRAWRDLQPEWAGREVELRLAEFPQVEADPSLLRQVYFNLLSNALKFSRDRSPAIIEAGWRVEAGERIFFVRDNGAGFNMRYVDKLFGVFQRLHRAEDFPGTGVGLAIVQRIIQRHGGRVWAEGEVDLGATFSFTLPAA